MSKERLEQGRYSLPVEMFIKVLPGHIQESDEISDQDKKVLGALISIHMSSNDEEIYVSNERLRSMTCIGKEQLMSAIMTLRLYGLIDRKSGTRYKKGQKAMASTYKVHFEKLDKPLKRVPFEELFAGFINKPVGNVHNDEGYEEEEEVVETKPEERETKTLNHCEVIEKDVEEYVPEDDKKSGVIQPGFKEDPKEVVVGLIKKAKAICLIENEDLYERKKRDLLENIPIYYTDETCHKIEEVFLEEGQRRMERDGIEVKLG